MPYTISLDLNFGAKVEIKSHFNIKINFEKEILIKDWFIDNSFLNSINRPLQYNNFTN